MPVLKNVKNTVEKEQEKDSNSQKDKNLFIQKPALIWCGFLLYNLRSKKCESTGQINPINPNAINNNNSTSGNRLFNKTNHQSLAIAYEENKGHVAVGINNGKISIRKGIKDLDIRIDELNSGIVKNIKVDYLTDENDLSKVYFILKSDKDIKSMESIATFDIDIWFNSDVPNKINVLGYEVILSKDKNICKNINKYNNSYTSDRYIYLNKNLSIYYMIIGILIIIILVLLKKGDNKDAIYKNKNKQRNKWRCS